MIPKNTNGSSVRKDGYQNTNEARKSKHKEIVSKMDSMDSLFGL